MTKDYLRLLIGENIRKERASKNMSIEELAEKLGLTPGVVSLIERGQRGATAYTLLNLSKLFSISIDSIFAKISKRYNSYEEITDPKSNDERKKKILSLTEDLTDRELDFLIREIKGIKAMNHTHPLLNYSDESE